ncbi:MAG: cupin domain-containing protein [Pseudomonadales bacterium]|nr:cupin domain-containing protein [Pseudomonadales bacterium]
MILRQLNSIPKTQVSHNPNISRQQILAMGEINNLCNFSQAIFPPGEIANGHRHDDMNEVFLITQGHGEIQINNDTIALSTGSCICVQAGEYHELRNTGSEDLHVTYFAILS